MGFADLLSRRLIHPLWSRRDDPRAAALRRELDRRQFDPPAVIAARQNAALRRVLRHAATTVPFYREHFGGTCIDDVATIDDLPRLPTLGKSDIRAHGQTMLSERFGGRSLHTKKTSGSTGVPLQVRLDDVGMCWKRACTLRSDEWSGWSRGQRVAKVWGNPEYRRHGLKGRLRNLLFDRAIHLDTLRMDDAALRRFAGQLHRTRPDLIFGHAHSVFLLADFLKTQNLPMHRPRGIITTAMVLHDWERQRIEAAFGVSVTNRYGCEEVSLIACECDRHRGLHVNADGVIVEVIKDGRPAPTGIPGAIVVTDLANFAMPLIRYQVGDVGVLSDRQCPCGRGMPILESLEGREADYVVTAAGELISGISLTENFAVLVPGVAQIQIVQEEVRRFVFRIVRAADFTAASEHKIAALVVERFGHGTDHRCEFVERIPQEPSGKYRFCISHVRTPHTGGRAAA
jgi:phenylacetate-CoA ligase